jgi:peptidoglycan/xylan/chitin deacetylase (PgdA/CDA1 family)
MNLRNNGMHLILSLVLPSFLLSCNGKSDKENKTDTTAATAVVKPVPGGPFKLDSSKRYIYLTWDDSPQPPGTTNCKAVFSSEGVKATFFVVGFNQVGPFKKRIIDSIRSAYPQFLLANHSFTHGFNDNYKKFYNMPDSAVGDLMKNERELQVPVKIIRLPGMNSWVHNGEKQGPQSSMKVCSKLDSMGYSIIGWDVEWLQAGKMKAPKQSADEMVKEVNKKFEDGTTYQQNAVVILSHDRLFSTPQYADSLRKFISILKQDPRNVFETIDHYPLLLKK